MKFVSDVKVMIVKTKQFELELGEAPDEYLDPLMATLMDDPVTLPSGIVIDRSTIKTHLLSDQHDPFNRQPLTLEQCVTNDALREEIRAWKQSKTK